MARNKNSISENYVFNVVGTRFDIPSIETKSTTNNSSGTIEHFGINATRAELRMTRAGDEFNMYSRPLGSNTWIHRSTFNRPDLPDTLQVGIIAYAFLSYPEELAVRVDYIRFEPSTTVNQWMGGNGLWSNTSNWSLNKIPDHNHAVIINNPTPQVIEILPGESFQCWQLDVMGDSTEFVIDGELEVLASGCK